MDSTTLQHARYYIKVGLRPIPVEPRGKKPEGEWKRWQTEAPTDAHLVRWFGNGARRNVGLVLGRGLLALDFDGPGAEALLAAAGVALPEGAPRSRTSNGCHVLLRAPGPVENRVALLASKEVQRGTLKPVCQVDVRGDGGFVVAPPSTHASGHVYEWEQRPDAEIPEAPASLLALLAAGKAPGGAPAAGGAPKWVTKALAGVGEGSRDATCARLAGYFLGKGHPEDVVRQLLYAFAAACRPPFTAAEVDKTVKSVQARDQAASESARSDQPFQVLGYNQGDYFYLPRGSRQVVALRAKQHSKSELLALAPLAYWESSYRGPSGPQWDMAANALIRQSEAAGVYDTSRIRGRGAWWDEGQVVLHLGDALVVDGRSTPIMAAAPRRYIYEAAAPMTVDLEDALGAREANRLVDICELVSWERPISARLLAGWVAAAPVCGALEWRPHVWLTGSAGAGKSWVLDRVIRAIVGGFGLAVQSETTQAGIRQTLGHDARPVIFDEAEGEDQAAQARIQNVLALMRQASSETGSVIIKGTAGGAAQTYRIRSCFALSSIGVGLQAHADLTRVSVLSIKKDGDQARFRQLKELVAETLTPEWVRRFLARSIRMVPAIRANAAVFAQAGAAVIGSQRLGDQVGALLGACYSLYQDGVIAPADAREWLAEQDWSEQKSDDSDTDERKCLQRILEHVARVQSPRGPLERSVAELLRNAAGEGPTDQLPPDAALDALLRMGIRVDRRGSDNDTFTVSSGHSGVAAILGGTHWSRGWARALRRLPGAQDTGVVRFAGVRGRGVSVPLEEIL